MNPILETAASIVPIAEGETHIRVLDCWLYPTFIGGGRKLGINNAEIFLEVLLFLCFFPAHI